MAKTPLTMGIKAATDLHDKLEHMEQKSENVVKKTVSDFKSRGPGWVNTAVSETYNIKKSDVKTTFKGTTNQLSDKDNKKGTKDKNVENIGLIYRDKPRTLRTFGMKPQAPPKKREKEYRRIPGQNAAAGSDVIMARPIAPYQVSAEVIKGQRKTVKGNVFIASSNGSGNIPFIRKKENRTEIQSVKTASVPSMLQNEKVKESIYGKVDEGLGKRLEHHLQQEMKKP